MGLSSLSLSFLHTLEYVIEGDWSGTDAGVRQRFRNLSPLSSLLFAYSHFTLFSGEKIEVQTLVTCFLLSLTEAAWLCDKNSWSAILTERTQLFLLPIPSL